MFGSLVGPKPAPVPLKERRAVARQQPLIRQARIAWRGNGLRFEKASVRLLDFCGRGARILSSAYPRVGRTVWVGLISLPHEWVKAEIRSSELSGNQWLCRLEFRETCPAGMLELLLLDPRLDGA